MNKDYKKIICKEFEKVLKTVEKNRNEINSAANIYLFVEGHKIRIPVAFDNVNPLGKCWDRDNLVIYGYLDGYSTKDKKLYCNTKAVKINLLNVDPEKAKFIIESQGYIKEKKTKSFSKKLRLALSDFKRFRGASIMTDTERQTTAVA